MNSTTASTTSEGSSSSNSLPSSTDGTNLAVNNQDLSHSSNLSDSLSLLSLTGDASSHLAGSTAHQPTNNTNNHSPDTTNTHHNLQEHDILVLGNHTDS